MAVAHPRSQRAAAGTLLLSIATLLCGCASLPCKVRSEHILMSNLSGQPVRPGDPRHPLKIADYDVYINNIFAEINTYCATKPTCKVLLFFHGGLNSQASSIERADKLAETIRAAGSYPIFVSWNSSFPSSYKDHLFFVHKGLREPKLRWAAPYILLEDEVKSIAQTGTAWFAETRHTFPRLIEQRGGSWKAAVNSYSLLVQASKTKPSSAIKVNPLPLVNGDLLDERSRPERFLSGLTLVPTLPTKLLAPPLLIQALGSGAWDVMRRRTVTLFRTEEEFLTSDPSRSDPAAAMLARFISRYQRDFVPAFCAKAHGTPPPLPPQTKEALVQLPLREESDGGCAELELTLVGHSMGSIIIDQLLRYAPKIQIRNLVYMAGATTVADYQDTVLPYLDRQRLTAPELKVPLTDVYHLILHPFAEIREKGILDLSPRGSLLVWIDNYFSNPVTPLDRTLGRFYNLMPMLSETPEELRHQVHVKVFRAGKAQSDTNPQVHGDFSRFPFWDPRFWDPDVPTEGGSGPSRCKAERPC